MTKYLVRHHVTADFVAEKVVDETEIDSEKNNLKPINQLVKILKDPYTQKDDIFDYQTPSNLDEKYQTFCGT